RWPAAKAHGRHQLHATSAATARCSQPISDRRTKAAISTFSAPTYRCRSRRFIDPRGACPMPAEIIEVETKYRGWCRLLLTRIRLSGGGVVTREIEDHGRAACLLAYDPRRRTAVVVRQLRAPALYAAQKEYLIEAIAGLIDEGEEAEK